MFEVDWVGYWDVLYDWCGVDCFDVFDLLLCVGVEFVVV